MAAPRAKINYEQDVGSARAAELIQTKRAKSCVVDTSTNCWLFKGSVNSDGYGQVYAKKNCDVLRTGRSSQTALLLHRLAFLASNGTDAQNHASHLCDRRNCFNPSHIVDESAQVNNSRKGCPGPIYCSAHGHLIVDLCAHIPRCVRPPRDDVLCCLSLRETDPEGWETQSAVVVVVADDSDFGDAEWLDSAVAEGLI